MKILVPVKRVIDYTVKVRVKADGSAVETENVKMGMNPFDEIALEEALRLKEKGLAQEVVAVSIGADAVQETLRAALALGADRAIHCSLTQDIPPLIAARLLRAVVLQEMPGLVLLGKQAIDDDANQTGQMLAALLGWGQATAAFRVALEAGSVTVTREVDNGLLTVRLALPAIITADLRLNTPRYASLPGIMKARAKPIARVEAASLGVPLESLLARARAQEPAARAAGIFVKSAAELVERLRAGKHLPEKAV